MTRFAGAALSIGAAVVGAAGAALLLVPRPDPRPAPAVVRSTAPATTIGTFGTRVHYPAGGEPALSTPGGPALRVHSLLRVDRPMKFGDFVWNDIGVPAGDTRIRVDLGRQIVSVFRGGHEIGTAVILYGTDHKPTPTGTFPILARARRHRSSLYDAEMPYMLRLTNDGVAIHASAVRRGFATHGCVGVPEAFARRLFDASARGDLVTIAA
jgi:lipoprotein-anchoring transpeptidase ErfK/SrfK